MIFVHIAEQLAHLRGFDTERKDDRLHFYQERQGTIGFDLCDIGSTLITDDKISAHAFWAITGIRVAAYKRRALKCATQE